MAVAFPNDVAVYGRSYQGQTVEFQNLLSLQFESDRFSPADSLQFSAAGDAPERISWIRMTLGGSLFFEGIVDQQQKVIGQNGSYVSFTCRQTTGRMLDNEVRPRWYYGLSSEQLIRDHALPYGAAGAALPKAAVLPQILAKKGCSHWEFITLFCRLAYHRSPYLNREGMITCEPFQKKEHLFSNSSTNGIPFVEAKLTDDRYLLLSRVWVKTGQDGTGASYRYSLSQSGVETLGILRERYYHPETEWNGDPALAARQYYEDRQAGYFEIVLTVPGLLDVRAGDSARFEDQTKRYGNLYVTRVRLISDSDGNRTQITLWEQNGLVNL